MYYQTCACNQLEYQKAYRKPVLFCFPFASVSLPLKPPLILPHYFFILLFVVLIRHWALLLLLLLPPWFLCFFSRVVLCTHFLAVHISFLNKLFSFLYSLTALLSFLWSFYFLFICLCCASFSSFIWYALFSHPHMSTFPFSFYISWLSFSFFFSRRKIDSLFPPHFRWLLISPNNNSATFCIIFIRVCEDLFLLVFSLWFVFACLAFFVLLPGVFRWYVVHSHTQYISTSTSRLCVSSCSCSLFLLLFIFRDLDFLLFLPLQIPMQTSTQTKFTTGILIQTKNILLNGVFPFSLVNRPLVPSLRPLPFFLFCFPIYSHRIVLSMVAFRLNLSFPTSSISSRFLFIRHSFGFSFFVIVLLFFVHLCLCPSLFLLWLNSP